MFKVVSLSTLGHYLRSAWTRHAANNQCRRELETSSDRDLAELGLCRGDIQAVVDGSYRR